MNRVAEALIKLSDEFHEMEKKGIEFNKEEDDAWADLTMIIQAYIEKKKV